MAGFQAGYAINEELKTETVIGTVKIKEILQRDIAELRVGWDLGLLIGAEYMVNPVYGLRVLYHHSLLPMKQELNTEAKFGFSSISCVGIFHLGGEKKRRSGSNKGPSAKVDSKGGVSRPGATGSSEIDNFVTSTFDLNDKIVDLKEKLESVSNGLSKSNAVLSDIGNSASGPVGWAMMELQKGIAKSKNNIIASAQSLQSDVPDLPEIYFDLIKESLIAPQTLAELAKGTQPEEALLLTFNKKADEKGIPTTSKDWIMGLNLDLDPTKTLRSKLGTIKDGVMGGKDKLASVPDDLKDIGSQAKTLLSSAAELPKAAKSLGLKAPKALKAIKATTDVLKNIPNEVKSIGDETKKVIEEVDQVLKNIQNILSTS